LQKNTALKQYCHLMTLPFQLVLVIPLILGVHLNFGLKKREQNIEINTRNSQTKLLCIFVAA